MKTFDDVIAEFDRIIIWAISTQSRLGYFAALYRNITILVKEASINGEFKNRALFEELDVCFAKRYFDALDAYKNGNLSRESPWYAVFELSNKKLTIVQHLVMSINVHVNFDLPISAAAVGPKEKILDICNDYFKLSTIFSMQIVEIEKDLTILSPLMSLLARIFAKIEHKLLNFSLSIARCESWECACKQAIATDIERNIIINNINESTNKISTKIVDPGFFANILLVIIRLLEFYSIAENIKILNEKSVQTNQKIYKVFRVQ